MGIIARIWSIIACLLWITFVFVGGLSLLFSIYWIILKRNYFEDTGRSYGYLTKWTNVYT